MDTVMENKQRLTPRGNRLLVLLIEEKETKTKITELKLILPESKDTYGMPRKGKIVAVGDGELCAHMDFKKDDIVFFSKWAGQPLKLSTQELGDDFKDDQVFLFLNTKDIYGRTYESDAHQEEEQGQAARGTGTIEGNTDSNENVEHSEEVKESNGAQASDVCEERKNVEP